MASVHCFVEAGPGWHAAWRTTCCRLPAIAQQINYGIYDRQPKAPMTADNFYDKEEIVLPGALVVGPSWRSVEVPDLKNGCVEQRFVALCDAGPLHYLRARRVCH